MRRLGRVATLGMCALMAACSSGAAVSPAPPSAAPSAGATPKPTIASPSPAPTLPPGVSFVEDGAIAPGTYWFDGFEPTLQIEIPGPGWEVGHFHGEIFDLFLGGDFPAIGFARFPTVATPISSAAPAGSAIPATSVELILGTLRSNHNIVVTDVGPVEISGLSGRTVDISVTAPQTAIFGAGSDGFHFDPGFIGRFHLLGVEGGALEIFVTHRDGQLGDAIEATKPILDSVEVVE